LSFLMLTLTLVSDSHAKSPWHTLQLRILDEWA